MLMDFTKKKFDIILQAGQSNAQGCGWGAVPKPFETNDKTWYLGQNFTIYTAQEEVWDNNAVCNFALPFSMKYIKKGLLDKDRNLLIIRAAVGGTGFLDKHWGMEDDLYLQMMEMIRTALALNSENRLVAFLWHQGETDATNNATLDGHYNNLLGLVQSVRKEFDCTSIPFIAADFVHDWKDCFLDICEPVISAIKAVCADIGNADFIETEGLTSNNQENGGEDTIHFSRKSMMELGEKYFDVFCKVKNAGKGA